MRLKYREEKATQAAARLLFLNGGTMNHMKLVKLLYLAEREALLRWGRPITFDAYFSLDHGPILSFTLDKINRDRDPANPSYWHTLISERDGHTVSLLGERPPNGQLSEAEESLLNEVFKTYGHLDQWQLRDFTHTLPEWTDPGGSSEPISIRAILHSGGFDESDIQDIEDALQAEESAREMLRVDD